MAYRPGFQPGDVVKFAGEVYIVVEDYGTNGRVRELYDPHGSSAFFWEFQGERVQKIGHLPFKCDFCEHNPGTNFCRLLNRRGPLTGIHDDCPLKKAFVKEA